MVKVNIKGVKKAGSPPQYIIRDGIAYPIAGTSSVLRTKKVQGLRTPKVQTTGFAGKLLELKAFVNRKHNTRKIESIVPNGKIKNRPYTTKKGVKNIYSFKGADVVYQDGTKESKFYHDLGYMIKNEW